MKLRERTTLGRRLATTRLSSAWNAAILAGLPLQQRLLGRRGPAWPLRVETAAGRARLWVSTMSDVIAAQEVFLDGQYADGLPASPEVILDIGANVGCAAIYFALRFPRATVHAIEPDPLNFALLRRNVAPFPRVTAHRLAIAATTGTVTLHSHAWQGISSSLVPRPNARPVDVPAMTLDVFLREHHLPRIDLLKFDVEGAENDLFSACASLSTIGALIGEVHDDLMPVPHAAFLSLFRAFDVDETSLSASRWTFRAAARREGTDRA
jgi:FkbM family methyltransferase